MVNSKLSQKGVSLVELILVIAVVITLSFLVANIPKSIGLITRSQNTSIAKDVAAKKLNSLRAQSYASLSNGVNSFSDTQLNALSQVSSTYEIEDCPVAVCPNGGNIKKVKVTVTWKEVNEDKKVELVSLIDENGVGK